ncbi:MAG TPA: site-2 protease family protein [Anaerolineae bacterium]|nr:site-2 protease family protein [Anaerolineae bacterium]
MLDLLIFIAVLAALILGHELGHFLVARLCRVPIEEFGIGFPPRLFTLFESGGTKFTFNLIPLGGFVRPLGEDDPDVPGGLASSPKRVRAAVLLAGPLANVILALVALIAAFKFAAPDVDRVLVTIVESNTPAAEAGILPGDLILSIEDEAVVGISGLQEAILSNAGEDTDFTIDRNGQIMDFTITPRTDHPTDQGPIGVVVGNPTMETTWPQAVSLGWGSLWGQFDEMFHLPGRLISGEVAPEDARVSGLKGMYDMLAWAGTIDRSAQRPFLTLNLIGIISVGLAIANLLPFPALDGGRLIFVGIEAVLGRRLSPRYEGLAHAIGFFMLLALMVYINLQDFINPINLPR